MLKFNLLPPKEKTNIRFILWTRVARAIGFGLGSVLLVGLVFLMPTFFFIASQEGDLDRLIQVERQRMQRAGIADRLNQVKAINQLTTRVNAELTPSNSPFELTRDLLKIVPPDIAFTSFRYDPASSLVAINGFSPKRSTFLTFLHAVEAHPRVKAVASPVSNIIEEANVKFTLSVTLR